MANETKATDTDTKVDFTDKEQVKAYIKECKDDRAKYSLCADAVKKAHKGDYPKWWFQAIMRAGLIPGIEQTEFCTPNKGTKCHGCHMPTATVYSPRGNAVCKDCARFPFAPFL